MSNSPLVTPLILVVALLVFSTERLTNVWSVAQALMQLVLIAAKEGNIAHSLERDERRLSRRPKEEA